MRPSPRAPGLMLRACVAMLTLSAARLDAQCPDGTPAPCKGVAQAGVARRANPALNARAWIVVPFTNVTRAQELDWLRDASVNLLSLDLSRWTDVAVVDDKRVGDLLRELPPVRLAQALTLNDGLALARRAGAGNLVMGDFFKIGNGARFVANVFDVRTGARVRSFTQQATEQDSLLTAFGPIARGVLAVPPPPDARTGDVGTLRLDAYQEYLLGVTALNRFVLDEADRHFRKALAIDSTFALAHVGLSSVLGWGEAALNGKESLKHALAAQRYGSSLPARARAMIVGDIALARLDFSGACAAYAPLVAKDSNDVQALFALGDCAYHDNTVVPGASDSVPGTFKWGWNLSLRSLRRVLQLEPNYHVAFEHILEILRATEKPGCVRREGSTVCEPWRAYLLNDGDSLVIRPVAPTNTAALDAQFTRSRKERAVIANLARARQIAAEWVTVDSTNSRAQWGMASVLLSLGDVEGADRHLRRASVRAYAGDFPQMRARMETAAKLGRGAESRAWFDSLVKAIPDEPSVIAFRGSFELMFGRLGRVRQGLAAATSRFGPAAVDYATEMPRVLLGLPGPDASRAEQAYLASMLDTTTCVTACRLNRVFLTLAYGMRLNRTSWPEFGQLASRSPLRLAHAWSRKDTAALRSVAVHFDTTARGSIETGFSDLNWSTVAVEGYLALGDTAAALRSTRFYVDTSMRVASITRTTGVGLSVAALWPRMMLLRADLAAATGSRAEARKWYARVIDLWSDADAELQPEVSRVRASLAALGPD